MLDTSDQALEFAICKRPHNRHLRLDSVISDQWVIVTEGWSDQCIDSRDLGP